MLSQRGIDLVRTEWLKALGEGMHELRIRHTPAEIARMFGEDESKKAPRREAVLLWVFVHLHGTKVVLLLGGYDKGADPKAKRQEREIAIATVCSSTRRQIAGSGMTPPPSVRRRCGRRVQRGRRQHGAGLGLQGSPQRAELRVPPVNNSLSRKLLVHWGRDGARRCSASCSRSGSPPPSVPAPTTWRRSRSPGTRASSPDSCRRSCRDWPTAAAAGPRGPGPRPA
ncbi:MAG: hypothetical protein M3527_00060 [Actinomycetota bacterium]|nr:hypothetical protein [Actinomycetota bacterium]